MSKEKIFSKAWWKQYRWQTILINLGIFFAFFVTCLLIDLLTKHYLFRWNDEKTDGDLVVTYRGFIFGVRSLLHRGSTLELNLGIPALHAITIIIVLGAILTSILIRDKMYRWIIPGLALIAAGSLGNMIDRAAFGGVRDIVFIPWADRGTFNFADVDIIFGVIYIVISIIVMVIVASVRDKKRAAQEEIDDEYSESVAIKSKSEEQNNNNSDIVVDPTRKE
ncbi:signal peptidase II [Metamycoplasma subdolum]|uniref:Signal peptidase II n=1 Tax=Metamycoplasma subdolum TaxID=92407 RepID=A0A3M0A8J8_9BACT|nr:signal peptidase II [Metamycoplasma subdolum]RMA79128.1 signal peptidase II [Metamycoplasma subdolum]WPB50650.1 signal peptidase II [Metamycoplasma subdolum]